MKKIILLIIASLNAIASIYGIAQIFKLGFKDVGVINLIEIALYIMGAIAFALIALKPELLVKNKKNI